MRGNGVSTAVLSLISRLKDEGIDVRLLASCNPDKDGPQPDYALQPFKIPGFQNLIRTNGFEFAKIDRKVMNEAVAWADVIHIMEGFPLEAEAIRIAERLGKPCVGTFHLFSENITANIGLKDETIINDLITWWWKTRIFNHCRCVHCPTEKVRQHLVEKGYKSRLEVISNGIDVTDMTGESTVPQTEPIIILCIGRLADEKSQTTLIDSMRFSRHAGAIQLHFAGNGPKKDKYVAQAQRLVDEHIVNYEPVFGFYDKEGLKQLTRKSYLYIHCARIEVEGLSCLEAVKEGTVPVIADSKLSATSQFALDDRSIFPGGDSRALAERIDWWIEHPDERMRMSALYAGSASRYDIHESTRRLIEMYSSALAS